MSVNFDLGKDPPDTGVFSYDEGGPLDPHDGLAVHFLFLEYPVGLCDLLFGIRQQRHVETVLFTELCLLFRSVGADTDGHGSCLVQPFLGVAEPARLTGSAGCIGLRVEEKHYGFSLREVTQPDHPAVVIGQ